MTKGKPFSEAGHVYELDRDLADIGRVRRWAEASLSGLHQDELVDVLLVVTELVTNVYDHARFPARVRLRKSGEPCVVAVTVEDSSPSAPVLRPFSPDSVRSRGLLIVNQLTKQWGVVQRAVGKSVWALIPCPLTV
ncbi:ATP-binding protein [Lentzea flaviverrucosa]|uniref:Anti-sigma regulatory factor (Ser/Thr protein kinase) n=1 Tax=Lentzea flaviverrucosa TaxID=200379 RepID=A0A1H9XSS1_9PSEU|nr:ATP-binding protein [Lentzea flaviverrucosa]RDI19266.1 anti-sigma regulatory factor (Ser/Thr protein kinase) [Lentzea flaviverrucosa]SES49208.1 Anti-sigma regulatory factor (Ser/Thr protein kinase) [Lentzea flaviverrucosa]